MLEVGPKGELTVNKVKIAIGVRLGMSWRQTFGLMSLRKQTAKALSIPVGDITIADMQSALNQLEEQGIIEKTKTDTYKASEVLKKRMQEVVQSLEGSVVQKNDNCD